jgi:hypothetical protein
MKIFERILGPRCKKNRFIFMKMFERIFGP